MSAAGPEETVKANQAQLQRFKFAEPHMGMEFSIIVYAPDEATARAAAQAAFKRIEQLNKILSDYEPYSELNELSRTSGSGKAVKVSEDLWEVLVKAQELATLTDGAFDVTVGPYVQLWRRARRRHQLPSAERLAEARAAVGYRHMVLDAEQRTVKLTVPNMRLDVGGIAKGYALDQALLELKKRGLPRALVEGGGDMALGEAPPDREGWRIGIESYDESDRQLQHYLVLTNVGVATSGDLYQFVELNGVRYSHIVDPRTGVGLTNQSVVTVIAPDCTTADSLATALSVLGPQAGLKLVESMTNVAARIVVKEDETARQFESATFKRYWARAKLAQ